MQWFTQYSLKVFIFILILPNYIYLNLQFTSAPSFNTLSLFFFSFILFSFPYNSINFQNSIFNRSDASVVYHGTAAPRHGEVYFVYVGWFCRLHRQKLIWKGMNFDKDTIKVCPLICIVPCAMLFCPVPTYQQSKGILVIFKLIRYFL